MSYEGFTEYLCEKGHYFARDVYSNSLDEKPCPACGSQWAYTHSVDQTNGYEEDNPQTCCAPMVDSGFEDLWETDHYGNRYAVKRHLFRPGKHWRKLNVKC